MSRLQKNIIAFLCCSFGFHISEAQDFITLQSVLDMAKEHSIEYQESKVQFISGFLAYKHYRLDYRPNINFTLNPASYNRSFSERYDSESNLVTYRETNTLNTNAGINVSQYIPFTGGNISMSSNLSRLQNFGQAKGTSFNSNPFRISLSQPLFTHNPYRWEKREMPLNLKLAKIKLVQEEQELNQKAAILFFELVKAYQLHELATFEVQSSDSLYNSGKMLLEIKRLTPLQLTDLQLKQVNARIVLAQREQQLSDARFGLNKLLFGRLPYNTKPELIDTIPEITIVPSDVLAKVRETNPFYVEIEKERLELQKKTDIQERQNRFSANLNLSYGLNQAGDGVFDVYNNPSVQQAGSVTLSIPFIDYGKGRDKLLLARMQRRMTESKIEARIFDFEHSLNRTLFEFNLILSTLNESNLAVKLASESYRVKIKQYGIGQVTLQELNQTYSNLLSAKENYLNSLSRYWEKFYEIQSLALYDLTSRAELKTDYDSIIEQFYR